MRQKPKYHLLQIIRLLAMVGFSQSLSAQSWQEFFNKAIDNAQGGNMQASIDNFDKAIAFDAMPAATKAQAYYFKGAAHGSLGEIEEAIAAMGHAIELNGNYAEAFLQRGLLYNNGNEATMSPENAIKDLEVATKLLPNNRDAMLGLGMALTNAEKKEEAAKIFTQLLEMNSNDAEVVSLRGIAYRQLGKFDLAMKDLNNLVRMKPTSSASYMERGILYSVMKNYEYAIRDYTQAIVYDQSNLGAYFNRGIAYGSIDNHQAAIADFSKVIQNNPSDEDAYFNRALELIFSGKEKDGCYDMDKAASLGSTLAVKAKIEFCSKL